MNTEKLIIYTEGAAWGNPGPAVMAFIIEDENGSIKEDVALLLGYTTNNQAEYIAIIAALEKAISLGAKNVAVKSDSLLVVKQINGKFKIKDFVLQLLYKKVMQLAGSLESFTITYIYRSQNAAAKGLAYKTVDTYYHPPLTLPPP